MTYIIKCVSGSRNGRYVTKPGHEHSYSSDLKSARTYPTREAAKGDCCGNEIVTTVEDEMGVS